MDDGGIGKLQRRLAVIPKAVKSAAQVETLKQAEAMAQTMRGFVPVDEGDLKNSIVVTPGGKSTPPYSQPGGEMIVPENAVAVTVGDQDVRYGHLVEYGTNPHDVSKGGGTLRGRIRAALGGGTKHPGAPAKPYFWPAVRLHNKKSAAAIKRAVRKAVRDNWGKA